MKCIGCESELVRSVCQNKDCPINGIQFYKPTGK